MARQKTAQERRADGRATRRADAPVDPPDVDEAVDTVLDESSDHQSPGDTLKTAASAALAAAAVGAARALAQRRLQGRDDAERDDAERDETDEPHEEEAPQSVDDGPAPADDADVQPAEPEQPEQPEGHEEEGEPRDPPPPGQARAVIDRAKTHLRDLRGAEAEAVSSVRRTRDGWRVALDVVEVHRIPDSTDVLGTYELDLDDDGELITLERTGRFYRSEAERR